MARVMQLARKILATTILAAFGGCVSSSRSPVTYYGTIDRVIERQGEFLSPIKGYRPLYCIYVQVADLANAGMGSGYEILVLDIYSPTIYGKAGDRIQFLYIGNLPSNRQLEFDSLGGYSILPNRG
jgi:hypothetical protein